MDRQQTDAVTDRPVVSIAIATYNRLAFLEQAVEAVLQNADLPFELIIWNNASGEDTRQWLDSLEDDRIRVIHSDKNAGCSAYELAFRQSRGDWLVTMDDDVLRLPENFLSKMRAALQACPDLGYVALDVVRDDKTNGSKPEEYAYKDEWHDGICLQFGPAGGWCAMTPRHLYEQVRFPVREDEVYFIYDGVYVSGIMERNYRCAILKDVRCYHATGVWWNQQYQKYWELRCKNRPQEARRMKLFMERGVFIKDTIRPWSVRKCLGDCKRWLLAQVARLRPNRDDSGETRKLPTDSPPG
jgi:glycosyltransferase involved in cell wall biosynthesis